MAHCVTRTARLAGTALAAAVALAACGSSAVKTDVAGASAPALAPKQITVTVAGDTITPKPATVTVKAGQPITLTVTSDRADEVHVHGIDKELELEAGVAGTLSFTATPAGSYEVETHKSGKLLFKLQVNP